MRKPKGQQETPSALRGVPLNSGVSFSETDGKWFAEVVLFTQPDEFYRITISGPSQTIVKETALSLLKSNISKR